MLYVRIELWKGGDPQRRELIADAKIANIGGTPTRGNYRYYLQGKAGSPMGKGEIYNFPRKRLMAWDLLYRVLRDARLRMNPDAEVDGNAGSPQSSIR